MTVSKIIDVLFELTGKSKKELGSIIFGEYMKHLHHMNAEIATRIIFKELVGIEFPHPPTYDGRSIKPPRYKKEEIIVNLLGRIIDVRT